MSIYLNSLSVSLPEKILTNFDFEKILDTTDEWIRTRTGIEQRHVLNADENPTSFAVQASRQALEQAQISPDELTHIIVATCTPEMFMPSMACIIAGELDFVNNKQVVAFDFNAACSGFIYGMELLRSIFALNKEAKILFVTSEFLSRKMNYEDRSTCVLFGDAAVASVFTSKKRETQDFQLEVIDTKCYTDGKLKDLITVGGGTAFQAKIGTTVDEDFFLKMQGREVYKYAVRSMMQSCLDILESNGLSLSDVRLAVPHQANVRIIEAVYDKLNVPESARFVNVQKYGNTSASSIPLALKDIAEQKTLKENDIILSTTFGGGLTWGSALFKTV